ncbi:UNVERIFIED_CONTAM: Subtilisin-like protease SBT3.9 [Sesamum latifolium]|uniref:Subtilisin-like protease SBT3.9 n=1 Tax=Sesamum latifolium TaxID=2727402 RepID=A0AAW2T7E5_9LAMI
MNAVLSSWKVYINDHVYELIINLANNCLHDGKCSKEATADSMIYSYRHGFSGFAAKMTDSQAQYIAELPGVVQVLPNRLYKMHTTRSWDYLGLSPYSTANLLHDTNQGDGAIIGVFDTGVWPESESFNDKGLGPIPAKWKGFCQSGDAFNPKQHCNKKIIGARYFINGFLAAYGEFNATEENEFISSRDAAGHGTHCASIADILKAFDEAIHDGVDVLSLSLGIGIPLCLWGGNSGPEYETVLNVAPWVISAAASTIDRSFPTPIVLGNKQVFTGQAMYDGKDTGFVKLAHKERDDLGGERYCEDMTSNDTWVAGKVVLCFTVEGRDVVGAVSTVQDAGALGLIATKRNVLEMSPYYSSFPLVLVTFDIATQILNYIRFTRDPVVRLKPTKHMSATKSPPTLHRSHLEPDIAAPGVDILAAYIPNTLSPGGYTFNSGTSMATPHIAGIAALLKSLHPHWSPAAIKSALVTTAWTTDPYSGEPIFAKGQIPKLADPFDYGGGLANPNAARTPGLVYDIGTQDYVNYFCAMGYSETAISQLTGRPKSCKKSSNSVLELNLPSITVPNLKGSVTITKTVINVGDPNSKYEAFVVPPLGTIVKVNPKYLQFSPEVREMSFRVKITTLHKITTEYYFGSLSWSDGKHEVKIPISVRTEFPQVYGN